MGRGRRERRRHRDGRAICDLYAQATTLHERGAHVVSCDEKTGIQALERARPALPLRPRLVERLEYEYVRHGTLCLIANLDVATGRVENPTIGLTHSEADFAINFVVDNSSRDEPRCSYSVAVGSSWYGGSFVPIGGVELHFLQSGQSPLPSLMPLPCIICVWNSSITSLFKLD